MAKRPGWYYTAEGRLRYHDENGWTEYYLDFDQVRNLEGPPPPPTTMLDEVLARQARLAASKPKPSRMRRLWRQR